MHWFNKHLLISYFTPETHVRAGVRCETKRKITVPDERAHILSSWGRKLLFREIRKCHFKHADKLWREIWRQIKTTDEHVGMELPSERIVSWVDPTQAGCMAGTHSIGLLQAGEPTEASKGHKAGHFQGISEGMEARMSRSHSCYGKSRSGTQDSRGPTNVGICSSRGF